MKTYVITGIDKDGDRAVAICRCGSSEEAARRAELKQCRITVVPDGIMKIIQLDPPVD